MKILFDHQTFSLQKFGGISRYNSELIKGIRQTAINKALLSVLYSENIHIKENNLFYKQFFFKYKIYKKDKFIYYINKLYSIQKIKEKKFDIFQATYYDSYFLNYIKSKPFVVTFHDMIHEKFENSYKGLKDINLINNKKQLAKQASFLIAVSECTKRDMIDILGIDSDKIKVIYHGSSFEQQVYYQKDNSEKLYLLYVGRREYYKNFEGMLIALYGFLKQYEIKLICAGGDSFSHDEQKLINSLGISAYVSQQSINDKKLKELYQNALAFIFPTLYEGFGIPVLEAFANNCPCIVSNTSSLPEVAGDAALYIDPLDGKSMVMAVEKILLLPHLRQELILKGQIQLQKFSWQRTVEQTLAVYQSII